jgi:lipopolysaccharide/colanic/teichoic acid biosynthesis glycosyltransferase
MNRSPVVKRAFDIVVSAVLLALFAPLMAAIVIGILLLDGRPVLFTQQRPGLYGRPFMCRKFRTMRHPRAGEVVWTTDEIRTTALGRLLRRTSMDELPQLWLVLTGRMSLVGPRPLLMEYLPKYSAHHRRRHDVRPGITGLAQVSGRRALTLGQRLDLDVTYVDTSSFTVDIAILIRTLVQPFQPGDVAGQRIDDVDDVGFLREFTGTPR